MTKFSAEAYNENGYTFQFFFHGDTWNNIEMLATRALGRICKDDKMHQKNGPWKIRNIDLAA